MSWCWPGPALVSDLGRSDSLEQTLPWEGCCPLSCSRPYVCISGCPSALIHGGCFGFCFSEPDVWSRKSNAAMLAGHCLLKTGPSSLEASWLRGVSCSGLWCSRVSGPCVLLTSGKLGWQQEPWLPVQPLLGPSVAVALAHRHGRGGGTPPSS